MKSGRKMMAKTENTQIEAKTCMEAGCSAYGAARSFEMF